MFKYMKSKRMNLAFNSLIIEIFKVEALCHLIIAKVIDSHNSSYRDFRSMGKKYNDLSNSVTVTGYLKILTRNKI